MTQESFYLTALIHAACNILIWFNKLDKQCETQHMLQVVCFGTDDGGGFFIYIE